MAKIRPTTLKTNILRVQNASSHRFAHFNSAALCRPNLIAAVSARCHINSSPLIWQRSLSSTALLKKDSETSKDPQNIKLEGEKPRYQLSFTCKVCKTRSTHNVSKQAYHNGTVLIQCPGCKNRHLIADHLKIFSDKRITLEDIMATKGEEITKKTINPNQLNEALENTDLEWEEMPKALSDKVIQNGKGQE